MLLIPIPAKSVYSFIKKPKVLKTANKICHKLMGQGIKDTIKLYDDYGIVNIKNMKKYYKKICYYI